MFSLYQLKRVADTSWIMETYLETVLILCKILISVPFVPNCSESICGEAVYHMWSPSPLVWDQAFLELKFMQGWGGTEKKLKYRFS